MGTSWEWWRGIGAPRFVCAPMVDASEAAFRILVRRYGVGLCYSPMINSKTFNRTAEIQRTVLDDLAVDYGQGPLFAQICGNDPEEILKTARAIEHTCDAVDINLGCPQKIAQRGHYGAFLLDSPDRIFQIVETLVQALSIPVTCKIRVLPERHDTMELVKGIERAGCSLLAVHGRTRTMLRKKQVEADFGIIRDIKRHLSIPVLANGSVETWDQVQVALQETEASGVMSAEGLLGNPALFSDPSQHCPEPIDIALEYLDIVNTIPERNYMTFVRSHTMQILYQDLAHFKEIRKRMGESKQVDQLHVHAKELKELMAVSPAVQRDAYTPYYRRYWPS